MDKVFEKIIYGFAEFSKSKLEHGVIKTSDIVFSPEIHKICQENKCGNYNKCWTCPPAAGSLEEHKKKIQSFPNSFVFSSKSALADSFDHEGMMKSKELHNRITAGLHVMFGKSHPVYGAGGCSLCKTCAYPETCKFPDKIFPSVEAAGINVMELSKTAGLKYNNGENTVTYFSMILY